MLAQVPHQALDVVRGHLQVRLADELRPAEAVCAVRVAGLSLLGEEENGLRVLVLHARHRLAAGPRDVEFHLPRRVRVEPHPHRVRGHLDLPGRRLRAEQSGDARHIFLGEHVLLREHQPVYRVVGDVRPVDQLVDDVRVGAEGQHGRHRPDAQSRLRVELGPLQKIVQVFGRVGPESSRTGLCKGHSRFFLSCVLSGKPDAPVTRLSLSLTDAPASRLGSVRPKSLGKTFRISRHILSWVSLAS